MKSFQLKKYVLEKDHTSYISWINLSTKLIFIRTYAQITNLKYRPFLFHLQNHIILNKLVVISIVWEES